MKRARKIISDLYESRELNECLQSIAAKYGIKNINDFKQELFLILLTKPAKTIIEIQRQKKLFYYAARITINLCCQLRNTYHQKYTDNKTVYSGFINNGDPIAEELPDQDFENKRELRHKQEQQEMELLEEYKNLDHHFGTWYHRELVAAIARHGNMNRTEKAIGIPRSSISRTIKKVREHINNQINQKNKNMKLINGEEYEIEMTDELRKHFNDPHNYTKEIIQQFEDSIYKNYISPKDKIILDIGANIGLFALHVSPFAKRLICVEPTPEHMKLQKELISCEHEQSALAGKTGNALFYWCGINTTMNSLQNRGDRYFNVSTLTLADLCQKHNLTTVDFCKIDIEGSEWQAITEDTIRPVTGIIKKIYIELHPPDQASQNHFAKIFENTGYKVSRLYHDTLFCQK